MRLRGLGLSHLPSPPRDAAKRRRDSLRVGADQLDRLPLHGVMVVYPDDDRADVGDRKEVRLACDRGEVFVHVAAVRGGHPPRADRARVGALVVRVVEVQLYPDTVACTKISMACTRGLYTVVLKFSARQFTKSLSI